MSSNQLLCCCGAGEGFYIGGDFEVLGGRPARSLASWDGSLLTGIATGPASATQSIPVTVELSCAWDGKLVLYGSQITEINNEHSQSPSAQAINRLVSYDASTSTWANVGGGMGVGQTVLSMLAVGTDLYIGGSFTQAGTGGDQITVDKVARFDGSDWHEVGPSNSGDLPNITAMAMFDGALHVAGVGELWRLDGSSWVLVDDSFTGGGAGSIRTMAVWNDDQGGGEGLYIGGDFASVAAIAAARRIVRWGIAVFDRGTVEIIDGVVTLTREGSGGHGPWPTWAADADLEILEGPDAGLYPVSTRDDDDTLTLVDTSLNLPPGTAFKLISDDKQFSPLAGGVSTATSTGVYALCVHDDGQQERLVLAGPFNTVSNEPGGFTTLVGRVSGWDGRAFAALGSAALSNGHVRSLASVNGQLFAGGWFTRLAGTQDVVRRLIMFDGERWASVGNGIAGLPGDLSVSTIGEHRGHVNTLTALDGQLYIGGNFTVAGGTFTEARGIGHWTGQSWLALANGIDPGSNVPGSGLGGVVSLQRFDGRVYLGGNFTQVINIGGTVNSQGIAAWNGNQYVAVGCNGVVQAMTVHAGMLVAAGEFGAIGPEAVSALRIAAFDGSDWLALGSGLSEPVLSVLSLDGDLYAGCAADGVHRWDGASWTRHDADSASDGRFLGALGTTLYWANGGQVFISEGAPVQDHLQGNVVGSGSIRSMTTVENALGVELIVAGDFTQWHDEINDVTFGCEGIVAFDGVAWRSVEPGIGGDWGFDDASARPYAIAARGMGLLIAGSLTDADSSRIRRVGQMDFDEQDPDIEPVTWSEIGGGADRRVHALAVI